MIDTIYGPRDEAKFEKRVGVVENDNERAEWVEYWQQGEEVAVLVHRSVHVRLKKSPVFVGAEQNNF